MNKTTQLTSVDMSDGGYSSAATALYWYCTHNYNGMGCPLYALLCRIGREFGLCASDSTEPGSERFVDEENYDVSAVYESLECGDIDPDDLFSDIADALASQD